MTAKTNKKIASDLISALTSLMKLEETWALAIFYHALKVIASMKKNKKRLARARPQRQRAAWSLSEKMIATIGMRRLKMRFQWFKDWGSAINCLAEKKRLRAVIKRA